MGTKEQLLSLFENNKGIYFSGEDIAGKLCVSRAAVWKAVKALQSDGYVIDAVQNKGYCLSENTDILSVQGIKKYLSPLCSDAEIEVFPVINSTNTRAREKAEAGAGDFFTVISSEQTAGRGRRGRSFYSPGKTGVYLSIVLRPSHCTGEEAVRFTTMAAVAVCEAIEAVSGEKAEIKWVNDVFVRGKKVCGILTEASFGLEDGFLDYAVLGIGINASVPDGGFPPELRDIAGAVFENALSDGKNRLAAEVMNSFMSYYRGVCEKDYIEQYINRSFVTGKKVWVISPTSKKEAQVFGIDRQCRLLVEYPDGKTEALSSGEISIRLS
ncbi:MAG: biotin--[acetyl-CoA-carboxylase] ligase [Clostridia bacterium]|nr:biotin--[acetyl-CoA-carboxylase] ligase [Clostridia bacterium]